MKLKMIAAAIIATFGITACSGNNIDESLIENESQQGSNEVNTLAENNPQIIKDMVNDYSVGNINDQSAAITSQQLIVTDSDGTETVYELPEDEFFVSIAPYIMQTHP